MRTASFFLVISSLISLPVFGEDRQDVSMKLNAITGQGLNPTGGPGRGFSLPPVVSEVSRLTEDDAVAIALWNSPDLEVLLSDLTLAQADLAAAGVLINPSLDVLFGIGAKPWEFLFKFPLQAFWQRPRRIAAAQLSLQVSSQNLVQRCIDLVRDTRIAHAELAAAQRHFELDSEASGLQSEIADLTDKRLASGDISELETRLVRLDALNSAARMEQSKRNVELALERLLVLMGASGHLADLKAVREDTPSDSLLAENVLTEKALATRSDLKAMELTVEAAGENAGWERGRVVDLLAIELSTKEVGGSGFKAGPGLSINLPVFDRNQAGISRAEAELEQAMLRYTELALRVKSEVRTSLLRLLQAKEQLERVRSDLLPALEETLALASNAYRNGTISYLDLQVARQPLIDALRSEEGFMLECHRSKAELERAVGGSL